MRLQDILDDKRISYVTEGPNVKRGYINIQCPWCGTADRSQHLCVNPIVGNWFCWRNKSHQGKTPHKLLMKLLNCSRHAADDLLHEPGELHDAIKRLIQSIDDEELPQDEQLDDCDIGLQRLTALPKHQRFQRYLYTRGFHRKHMPMLAELYDLRCGVFGQFRNRIVFPVRYQSKIKGYVGRCIDDGRLRYLSIPGKTVKRHILWHDLHANTRGRHLLVTEGPLDALKLDYISRIVGTPDRATCLFGTRYSSEQVERLHELSTNFEDVVIVFDRDALEPANRLRQELIGCSSSVCILPESIKDPGEMSWEQTVTFLQERIYAVS